MNIDSRKDIYWVVDAGVCVCYDNLLDVVNHISSETGIVSWDQNAHTLPDNYVFYSAIVFNNKINYYDNEFYNTIVQAIDLPGSDSEVKTFGIILLMQSSPSWSDTLIVMAYIYYNNEYKWYRYMFNFNMRVHDRRLQASSWGYTFKSGAI